MLGSSLLLSFALGAEPSPDVAPEQRWPPVQRPDGMAPGVPEPAAPQVPSPETEPVPDPGASEGPSAETEPSAEPDASLEPAPTPEGPVDATPTESVEVPTEPDPHAPGDETAPAPGDDELPEWAAVEPTPQPAWLRVESPSTPLPPPPPPPDPIRSSGPTDRPQESGRGFLIAAGALGTTGLIVKGVGTAVMLRSVRDGEPFIDPLIGYIALGTLYNPVIGGSLTLLGGGMFRRGRAVATGERDGSLAAARLPPAVGWGLFGGGLAVWVTTRLVGLLGCSSPIDGEQCSFRVWEAGYYGSLALTVPGVALGAYSTGYRRTKDKTRRRRAELGLGPARGRGTWGLGITGRF